jgi:hypothetical protein
MANYSIDSASIVRVLARNGHTHRCVRCEARMLVRHASKLCVHCFNDLQTSTRAEREAAESARVEGRARLAVLSALETDDEPQEGAAVPALTATR